MVDYEKCKCRKWKQLKGVNSGKSYDNIQCSKKKKNNTDFCGTKTHNDNWWLGFVTEPRPEILMGGKNNTRHYWHDQYNPKKDKNKENNTSGDSG